MSRPLALTPDARAEFDDAHAWYEAQRKGLGKRFRAAVRDCFRQIRRAPASSQIVRPPDVRRAFVRGFPYVVTYRVAANGIRVISVFHTSRDPGRWQQRADEDTDS
jgi:plasmid stabilization system protein ParE